MTRGEYAEAVPAAPIDGPWELPDGWRWERLGDLCAYVSRGRSPTYVKEDGVTVVNQRCVRWGNVDLSFCKQTSCKAAERVVPEQVLREGDILWNSTGTGTIGRAAIFKKPEHLVLADSHVTIIRPGRAMPRWIEAWISTLFVQQKVAGIGSTNQVELSRDVVMNMPVPFVEMDEQRRIVARLDALFAEIEEGEQALAEARTGVETYRKALLKAAATGELTADWREMYPQRETGKAVLERMLDERRSTFSRNAALKDKTYKEPIRPSETLPKLPNGWAWATIDQVCSHLTSGSRAWAPYYDKGTCTFVMAQNVRPGRFDGKHIQLVDPPFDDPERKRTKISDGDLLLTIVGANTGDLCRIDFAPNDYYVCQSVALLRPLTQTAGVMAELLFSNEYGRKLEMNEMVYGAGRPHLSFDQIRSLSVPLCGSEECAEISRLVSSKLGEVNAPDANELLPALRQSVLAAAFRGELDA